MAVIQWVRDMGNGRQWLLRAMGWLHCGLLYSLYYGAVLRFLFGEEVLPGAVLRGLWTLPLLAAADLLAQVCRRTWQYILCALGLCALGAVLLGHWTGALPLALACLFRGEDRLREEPHVSALDRPTLPACALFLLPLLYTVAGKGGFALQKLTLLWAALYLLVWAAHQGLSRLDGYLALNRGVARLPGRRIARTTGVALAVLVALAAGLLLPAILREDTYYQFTWELRPGAVQVPQEAQETESMAVDMADQLAQLAPPREMHPVVRLVLDALAWTIFLGACLLGAYQLLRVFRGTFVDHRDVVQFLGREAGDEAQDLPGSKRRRPPVWDRSPNARVRRKYRRAVLRRGKERPAPWQSPAEIEAGAGLEDPHLHRLYERARYSREGCTPEESRSLKY